jgi:site-specific DNA recombinase
MGKLHIYSRVSSDSQEDNTSLQNQREKGINISNLIGMSHQVWNEGVGSSSTDDLEQRPVISQLMKEVMDGKIKHLYVEYTDRLSRNQKTWGFIRYNLQINDVKLYTGNNPIPMDLSSDLDNLLLGIMSEFSIFDNRMRTNRLNTGKFNRIKLGYWLGGPPPFGYSIEDKRLVENKDESKWVKVIYQMYSDRNSIEQIRKHLMMNGVLTRRGNPTFTHRSLEMILENTHYSGYYKVKNHRTGEEYTNECPSIISVGLRDSVDKIKAERSYSNRIREPNKKYTYLLDSNMYCKSCGCRYGVKRFKDNPNRDYYFCKSKELDWRASKEGRKTYDCDVKGSVKVLKTDELVFDTVVSTLEKSNIFKEISKKKILSKGSHKESKDDIKKKKTKISKLRREIDTTNNSIHNLTGLLSLGTEEGEQFKSTIDLLMKRKKDLIEEMNSIDESISIDERNVRWVDWLTEFSNRIETIKNDTDIESRKRFIDGVVERIEVLPKFDGGLEHQIDIHFNLPYVDDKLVWNDEDKKSKGYTITDGNSDLIVRFTDGKKI